MPNTWKLYAGISTFGLAAFSVWHDSIAIILIEIIIVLLCYNLTTLLWALEIRENQNQPVSNVNEIKDLKENIAGLISERTMLSGLIREKDIQITQLTGFVNFIYATLSDEQRNHVKITNQELKKLLTNDPIGEIDNEDV